MRFFEQYFLYHKKKKKKDDIYIIKFCNIKYHSL